MPQAQDGSGARLIETDALIIGAGPVGLFAVFELGLQEVHAHVVDALPSIGGQCIELYADKPIYDIPALPAGSGRELVARLLRQAQPFAPTFHLGQQVSALHRRDDGRFDLATTAGEHFIARSVVIAGGVGAFQPRSLKLAGVDRHRGRQLFEHAAGISDHGGKRVVILGAGEAAVAAAIAAAQAPAGAAGDGASAPAASVTLVHRRDDFDASAEQLNTLSALRRAGRIGFVAGQPERIVEDGEHLSALAVLGNDGVSRMLELDALYVLLGWSPKLGPIADWGLALEKKQLVVDTERFETSVTNIFAAGDITSYPGKRKLIVCGFHEATLAAFAIGERLYPERVQPLQYTTTSSKLHELLGVTPSLR